MIRTSIFALAAMTVAVPAFGQSVPAGEKAWAVRAQACLDRPENQKIAPNGLVTTRGDARKYLGLPGAADDHRYTIFHPGPETDAIKSVRAKCNDEAKGALPQRVVTGGSK